MPYSVCITKSKWKKLSNLLQISPIFAICANYLYGQAVDKIQVSPSFERSACFIYNNSSHYVKLSFKLFELIMKI